MRDRMRVQSFHLPCLFSFSLFFIPFLLRFLKEPVCLKKYSLINIYCVARRVTQRFMHWPVNIWAFEYTSFVGYDAVSIGE